MEPTTRTAVVTGATRGIGLATTMALSRLGWTVVAGARRPDDLPSELHEGAAGPGRIIPVRLDVTSPDDHATVAATVAGTVGATGLDGLVNNAGSTISAPLEFLPLDELRAQLEVNLVGQLGVTQALLPLLREAGGRIVNMSSIGGLVAGPILGPYHISKFALEALSDSLRREVRHLGVSVSVVEPATVRTGIWDTGVRQAEALHDTFPPEVDELYGHLIEHMRDYAVGAAERGMEPEAVAAVVCAALTSPRPRPRYLVGGEARIARIASRVLPTGLLDRFLAPDPTSEPTTIPEVV